MDEDLRSGNWGVVRNGSVLSGSEILCLLM